MLLRGLARVHAALRRGLDTVVRVADGPVPEAERAAFADFTGRFTSFLRSHHDGEEQLVFPALQQGLPDQAAQVAKWRADHEALLGALAELEAATTAFAAGGPQPPLARASTAVRALLFPHLDAEEAALDEPTLARAFPGAAAEDLVRGLSRHGQKTGGPRVLMFLLHGLTAEEQHEQLAALPWLVRRVLVRHVWARGYRPLLKYAHNPTIGP
jgi:hypothetical protein